MGDVDERIRYILEAEGQRRVSAAYDEVADSIERSSKAQDRLSQQLKAGARLADVEARSQQRASQARAQQVAGILQAVNANRQYGTSIAANSLQLTQLAQKAAITGGSISLLGSAFGRLTPAAGAFGSSIGGAVSSLGGLAAGFGPAGIALSVLTAAVGVGAAAWQAFGGEEEKVDKTAQGLNNTLERQLQLLEDLDRKSRRASLLSQGLAGSDTQLAEVRRLEAERDRVNSGLIRAGEGGNAAQARQLDERRRQLEQELQRARAQLAESRGSDRLAAQEEGAAEIDELNDAKAKAAKDAADKALAEARREAAERAKLASENASRIKGLRELEAQYESEQSARRLANLTREGDDRIRIKQEALAREFEIENEARAQSADAARRDIEQRAAVAKEVADTQRAAVANLYNTMASSAGSAVASIVAGQKVGVAEVLKGIGSTAAGQGTVDLLQATFKSLDPFTAPIGVAQIPIALGEIAAGVALGGAGAAIGAGGGSASAARTAPPGARPPPAGFESSPVYQRSGATDTGAVGGRTINVTYAPYYATPSQAGSEIKRMIQEAERQGL